MRSSPASAPPVILVTYAGLTWLAKRTLKRPQRFFTEVSANIDRHILAEGYFEGGVSQAA